MSADPPSSTSQAESSTQADPPRRSYPQWVTQLLLPVAVAIVGTLLVTALTPLGESLRELLFPTEAAVTGSVHFEGQPVVDASLRLDGADPVTTDGDGGFLLVSVGRGEHHLHVEMVGGKPLDRAFAVGKGESRLDLGAIEIDPLVQLGYIASVAPSAGSLDIDYDLTLWINADRSVLDRINSVAYTLPAPLPTDPVAGGPPQQAFCYRETGGLAFADLFPLGGAFGTAAAYLDLGDGQPFQVTALPGESLPNPTVNCPVNEGDRPPPSGQTLPPPTGQPPPSPSQPQPMVPIPDVRGAPVEEAQMILEDVGLVVEVVRQPSDQAGDTVLGTDPPAGQTAPKGSTVELLVAEDEVVEELIEVPDVRGLPEETARQQLEQAGFQVAIQETSESPERDPGTVASQDPSPGEQEPPGSTVTIFIQTQQ